MKNNLSQPGYVTVLVLASLQLAAGTGSVAAQSNSLAPGVRGIATRAPANMKIDGDLAEFKGAF